DLSGKTVRLHRALYGCKQSSRAWNMHLTATLKSFGFEQSEADPCLFRYMDEKEVPLLVVTHVDDMIAAGSVDDCDALCEALSMEFPTNNLGPVSWYTGCAFGRDWEKGTLTIKQTAYIDQLCERFDVSSPSPLPATAHEQTLPRQDNDEPGPEHFRELTGALLWVVCMSRLDISNPVRALARYSQDPSKTHWHQGIKILRYLLGTRTWGINY
ncbi:unnamed protein product, partial [Discosporangium mesarthrocarpum]